MRIDTFPRPYLVTFLATNTTYPLTSDEAQRLLDAYPAVSATSQRVVLQGHNTGDSRQRTVLQPATRGGGPAFRVSPHEPQTAVAASSKGGHRW